MVNGVRIALGALLSMLCMAEVAMGDVFAMGNGVTSLKFVALGAVDNQGDPAGKTAGGNGPDRICGVVTYDVRIGQYEVTVAQYTEFLNAVAASDPHNLYSLSMQDTSDPVRGCGIIRGGLPGSYTYRYEQQHANRPVNYVSWGDGARFCNWLYNGQPAGPQSVATTEDGSYILLDAMTEEELHDCGYTIPMRYFFPTEDEWHKAAYYSNGVYNTYPTRSNAVPGIDMNAKNAANFTLSQGGTTTTTLNGPPWRTPVGAFVNSRGPFNTYDQAGNVWEWMEESDVFGDDGCGISHDCEDTLGRCKVIRGGAFNSVESRLRKAWRDAYNPANERFDLGFRIGGRVGITDRKGITETNDPGNIIDPYTRAVGGISINADGVLTNASLDELGQLRKLRCKGVWRVPNEIVTGADQRKVSLRGIERIVSQCVKRNCPLPDVAKYLGGLQRIEYVFVYPETEDIVLVGPGEGWKVDSHGNVVGVKSGRPVLLLDDLIVALRSATQAAKGGISCSIDPTEEGLAKLRKHAKTLTTIGDPAETAAGIESALGVQQISVHGVPGTSHFAHVLIAADYRMKRIAMGFERAPVKGLPSYLQMITSSGRGMSNMLPRWWLEPKYDPLLRDAEGVAWQLRGAGVQAMTEEDFLDENGEREHTGNASPMAKKWADNMTAKYDELAVAEPIFGELQNCMELAVVAALVVKERLLEKARCSLPTIMDDSGVRLEEYPAAKAVDSKASVLKKGHNWIISASGGVLINSWEIVNKSEVGEAPARIHEKSAAGKRQSWFWN